MGTRRGGGVGTEGRAEEAGATMEAAIPTADKVNDGI